MSINHWEHPKMFAMEVLKYLEANIMIANLCSRDANAEFNVRPNGYKIGDVISFKTHGEYKTDEFSGQTRTQPIQSSSRVMKIEKHLDVTVEITDYERSLDLDSLSEQVLQPAVESMVEKAEEYFASKILDGQGLYASSDLFGSAQDVANARYTANVQRLAKNRFTLMDLELETKLIGQEWFNQSQTRGDNGVRTLSTGEMGKLLNMSMYSSEFFPTNRMVAHTTGNLVAVTPAGSGTTVNKINNDQILTITAGGTGGVNAGDRLKIAGVKRPVIVATTIADISAVTEIPLAHPITEIIPEGSAITTISPSSDLTYRGAIFDGKALAIASPRLDAPSGVWSAVVSNKGLSCRVTMEWVGQNKLSLLSIDTLLGAFCLDPRRICLLADKA